MPGGDDIGGSPVSTMDGCWRGLDLVAAGTSHLEKGHRSVCGIHTGDTVAVQPVHSEQASQDDTQGTQPQRAPRGGAEVTRVVISPSPGAAA